MPAAYAPRPWCLVVQNQATITTVMATAVPSAQPATTSESQCTASTRRLTPTSPASAAPVAIRSSLVRGRRATTSASVSADAMKSAAAPVACPEGNDADPTVMAWSVIGGRPRPKANLVNDEARPPSSSANRGAAARNGFAWRRQSHKPVASPTRQSEAKPPTVLTHRAAVMSASDRCSTNQSRVASSWEIRPPPSSTSWAMSKNSARLAATTTPETASARRDGGRSARNASEVAFNPKAPLPRSAEHRADVPVRIQPQAPPRHG